MILPALNFNWRSTEVQLLINNLITCLIWFFSLLSIGYFINRCLKESVRSLVFCHCSDLSGILNH